MNQYTSPISQTIGKRPHGNDLENVAKKYAEALFEKVTA
jgi:hypothetical protein